MMKKLRILLFVCYLRLLWCVSTQTEVTVSTKPIFGVCGSELVELSNSNEIRVRKSFNTTLTGVDCSEDESIMLASSRDKGCFVSKDRGSSWSQEKALPVDLNWVDVAISDNGRVLAVVAEQGSIHVSNDGGKLWVETSAPKALWRAIALDKTGQYLAAVAAYEGIYVSFDFGITWMQTNSEGKEWQDLSMDKSGQHLAAAVKGGKIYISSDRGLTWKESLVCQEAAWEAISSDWSGQNLAAVISGGGIFRSDDYGETWEEAIAPREEQWGGITYSALEEAFLVVGCPNFNFQYISLDGNLDDKFLGVKNKFLGSQIFVRDVPTSSPTIAPSASALFGGLQFEFLFLLNDVVGNSFDERSLTAVQTILLNLLSIPSSQISVKYEIPNGHRFKSVSQELTSMILSVEVSVGLADFPHFKGNRTMLYHHITSLISSAVDDRSLENDFQAASMTFDIPHLALASVAKVEFRGLTATNIDVSSQASAFPSSSPSSFPTCFPSMAPSQSDYSYYVQFDIFIGLFNVTASSLTPDGQTAVLQTIMDVTDLSIGELQYEGITNRVKVDGRRRLLPLERWDMVVRVQATFPLSEFPQFKGNATRVYEYLKSLLSQSVVEEVFQNLLRQNALINAPELYFVTTQRIQFSNFVLLRYLPSPTSQPSMQPSSQPTGAPSRAYYSDVLEFEAFYAILNVSASSISSAGESSLLQAKVDVLDIPSNQVSYTGVTDLLSEGDKFSMVVATKVVVPLDEFSELQGNATKIYNYLTSLLTESVKDGTFTKLLQKESRKLLADEFYWSNVLVVKFKNFRLSRETKMPSMQPTAMTPATSPAPSTTSAPSISSAPSTTSAPSISSAPSTTSAPSISSAPSTTSAPSISSAPSVSPSVFLGGTVQFKVLLTLSSVPSSSFPLSGQIALSSTVGDILVTSSSNVEFLSVRSFNPQRHRRLQAQFTISVALRATLNLFDYPEFRGNGTKLFLNRTAIAEEAVKNGDFTDSLRLNARTFGSLELRNASVLGVQFEDVQINNPQVESVNAIETTLNSASLAAIISCSIVGFAILLFILYIGLTKCREKSKDEEEEEVEFDEEVSDEEDQYELVYRGGSGMLDFDEVIEINIDDSESAAGDENSDIQSSITSNS